MNRFADFAAHPAQPGITLAVLEDHTNDTPAAVVNSLVVLSSGSAGPAVNEVASGTDFYAAGRWSPSGKHICWVQWTHPDMCVSSEPSPSTLRWSRSLILTFGRPWEGSELWVAEVAHNADGTVNISKLVVPGSAIKVAGVSGNVESVSQPRWALAREGQPEKLVFLSDRTGFYELYQYEPEGNKEVKPVLQELTGADVGGEWLATASGQTSQIAAYGCTLLARAYVADKADSSLQQVPIGSSGSGPMARSPRPLGSRTPRMATCASSRSTTALRTLFQLPTCRSQPSMSSRPPKLRFWPLLPLLPPSSRS